jgi:hypothetical protein
MDVSRVSRLGQAQIGKTGKAATGTGFTQMLGTPSTASPTVTGTTSASALDALLAVQEAESALDRKAKARRRASDLLDGLDHIRDSLLSGQLSPMRLQQLGAMVASHREDADDPQLTALLDDIELRVQVELAKLEGAVREAG